MLETFLLWSQINFFCFVSTTCNSASSSRDNFSLQWSFGLSQWFLIFLTVKHASRMVTLHACHVKQRPQSWMSFGFVSPLSNFHGHVDSSLNAKPVLCCHAADWAKQCQAELWSREKCSLSKVIRGPHASWAWDCMILKAPVSVVEKPAITLCTRATTIYVRSLQNSMHALIYVCDLCRWKLIDTLHTQIDITKD